MPQLARAAQYQGAVARFFKCPYQAKVMKTLLPISSSTVCSGKGRFWRVFMAEIISGPMKKALRREPQGFGSADRVDQAVTLSATSLYSLIWSKFRYL